MSEKLNLLYVTINFSFINLWFSYQRFLKFHLKKFLNCFHMNGKMSCCLCFFVQPLPSDRVPIVSSQNWILLSSVIYIGVVIKKMLVEFLWLFTWRMCIIYVRWIIFLRLEDEGNRNQQSGFRSKLFHSNWNSKEIFFDGNKETIEKKKDYFFWKPDDNKSFVMCVALRRTEISKQFVFRYSSPFDSISSPISHTTKPSKL